MLSLSLPYGKSTLEISLPESWLGVVVQPRDLPPAADSQALIQAALRSPIGSPALRDLVKPGMRVALIVDDFTRKTPAHLVLPFILEELKHAGLSPGNIRIVLALGTHRPMTEAEARAKLGPEACRGYEIVNVPASDLSQTVYLGKSPGGITAWVNRVVAEADLRIGVGMITPHLETGYTGGSKIILPGACGEATVNTFHQASAFIPENQLGKLDAPLRRNLEQFVAEVIPLHFIVNLVLTLQGDIYACVVGDAVKAHRAGVLSARQVYGVPVDRPYPVVLADASPYDQDLWQSVKGIYCGDLLVEDGGTLIILTAATEANSAYPLLPGYTGRDPDELLQELRDGTTLDPKQAATGVMIARLRRRIRLMLVSAGLSRTDANEMRIPRFETVGEALQAACDSLPRERRQGSLAVIPRAGVILPYLEDSVNAPSTRTVQDEARHAAG
jgi:nickel-dependent lactate racemase